jgi:hypothetical protein
MWLLYPPSLGPNVWFRVVRHLYALDINQCRHLAVRHQPMV